MELPKRKLPRLSGYNYATENYYFITICTHQKKCLFGDGYRLNPFGLIAQRELENIPQHFSGIRVDKFVIMPNHIHAVVIIGCDPEAERSRPFPTLSTVVGLYKSGVSKLIHQIQPDVPVWQKSFYNRVLRRHDHYTAVWQYIDENPRKWHEDEFYSP